MSRKIVVWLIVLLLITVVAAEETDQSHPAEEISAGTIAGALTITSDGKIGIGTTIPQRLLSIEGIGASFGTKDTSVGGSEFIFSSVFGGSAKPGIGTIGAHSLGLFTNSLNRLHITSTGNVGIGTDTPSEKLDVTGNIKASGTICDSVGCIGDGTSLPGTCAKGQVLKWNSAEWVCAEDNENPSDSGSCIIVSSEDLMEDFYEVNLVVNGKNICEGDVCYINGWSIYDSDQTNSLKPLHVELPGPYLSDTNGNWIYDTDTAAEKKGTNGDSTKGTLLGSFSGSDCRLYDDEASVETVKDKLVLQDSAPNEMCVVSICPREALGSGAPLPSCNEGEILKIVDGEWSCAAASSSSAGTMETIIVEGNPVNCLTHAWTTADAVCPEGYTVVGGGCEGYCINIAHPNEGVVDSSTYRCHWWTGAQDLVAGGARIIQARAVCVKAAGGAGTAGNNSLSLPACSDSQILKYNATSASWECAEMPSSEDSAPLKFEVYNPDISTYACIHDVDLEDYCGDEDGCTIRLLMQHETDGYDQVHIIDEHIYMEQPDLSNNRNAGIYGWTRQSGGGDYAWVTGTTNLYYTIFNPWDWVWMLNYKHPYCPDQTVTSSPYTNPYMFTFMSHPYVRATFIVYDSFSGGGSGGGGLAGNNSLSLPACSDSQILKYNAASSSWECAAEAAGGRVTLSADSFFTVTKTGPRGTTVQCPSGTVRTGCSGICDNAKSGGGALAGDNGCSWTCDDAQYGVTVSAVCLNLSSSGIGYAAGAANNDILSSCQVCVRYADSNGRSRASWRCAPIEQSVDTDFVGDVNSDDDFDVKVTCTDASVQDNYQLCRRYADVNARVQAPWVCAGFGQELLTDFVGDVSSDDNFDIVISPKAPSAVMTQCGICARYADNNGRSSAGFRCAPVSRVLKTDFIGDVDSNDDLDLKLTCNILFSE